MDIRIETSDLNRLAVELTNASGKAVRLVSSAIAKTAHDIEADAKLTVAVDTGNLRNSISSHIGLLDAVIGPTASYGGFVEYGTSRMAPQPYMGPAADRHVPLLVRAIASSAENIL